MPRGAFLGLMTYSFARVGAAMAMEVEGFDPNGRRWWARLHEKGGKRHELPAHHNLEAWVLEYIEAAGIAPRIGNHTIRATGIAAYLESGDALTMARTITARESPRTRNSMAGQRMR